MDEEDDLVPQPDDKGQLILSNRAWVNLDPIIWTMSMQLVKLDVSYNHLVEIPAEIAELIMLKELNAAFNKITNIPPEIGRLKRIRKLSLNSNRIRSIPAEIGSLELCEELYLNENIIEEIPDTIAKLTNLKILKLMSNKLRTIPFEIANILSLEEFDCGNNPYLAAVPSKWRSDTESLLFTCRIHRDYSVSMVELNMSNSDLASHTQLLEQENLLLKEKIIQLQSENENLMKHMPKKIARKLEEAKRKAMSEDDDVADKDKKDNKVCIIS